MHQLRAFPPPPEISQNDLISQDLLAGALGVTSAAITNWHVRRLAGLPACELVYHSPGKPPRKVWRRRQIPEWRAWMKRHSAEHGNRVTSRNTSAGAA